MNKKVSLAAVVRDRRLALGYSLGQLATKVNKTAASIRSWEKGDSFPTAEDAKLLGSALDLDADFLSGLLPATPSDAAAAPQIESDSAPQEPEEVPATDLSAGPDQPAESKEAGSADQRSESDDDASSAADSADDGFDEVTQGGEALTDIVAELTAVPPADDLDEEAAIESSPAGEMEQPPGVTVPPIEAGTDAPHPAMHEAMTEAVPVVPAAAVAVAEAQATSAGRPKLLDSFAARDAVNPVLRTWDSILEWYRGVFDPRRQWIYRVRFVLLMIALYILLRVLVWSGGELWDAIGEVLDGIAFSPTETPDVSN